MRHLVLVCLALSSVWVQPVQPAEARWFRRDNQLAAGAVIPTTIQPLSGYVNQQTKRRTITVPADTVINVALSKPLNSSKAIIGDAVTVTVKEAVYIGPYLAVPAASQIHGKVTAVKKTAEKNGPNPYVVVNFTQLKRPDTAKAIPVDAELIAYRTGLKKTDYLWKLPQPKSPWKSRLGSMAEGALVGFFINPVVGAPIGAGAGLASSMTLDKMTRRSGISIKPGVVIPIAVQQAFKISVES